MVGDCIVLIRIIEVGVIDEGVVGRVGDVVSGIESERRVSVFGGLVVSVEGVFKVVVGGAGILRITGSLVVVFVRLEGFLLIDSDFLFISEINVLRFRHSDILWKGKIFSRREE